MLDTSILSKYTDEFIVGGGKDISLKAYETDYDQKELSKEQGEQLLQHGIQRLAELQDKLYASSRYSLLIVIQAMDAAGKDGLIKHVMTGLNPQGVKVTSFKAPSTIELKHDYLWRHYLALPAQGEIGIFNRSHYENVLVTRVHPELILKEKLPGIVSVDDINNKFWERRFQEINHFEETLYDNGMIILKFFLHISKKEQKKRFLDRIDDPKKNWKFETGDLKEREYWKDYRKAYEALLSGTSNAKAPWFVIPADDKWFTRLTVAGIIYKEMEKLNLKYPAVADVAKTELAKARLDLTNENGKDKSDDSDK
jgi:PPK2 family polyphosphate:nucleotide phosphotransferase